MPAARIGPMPLDGPMPRIMPGRQVLLDLVGRGRGRCAQEPCLELLAVCPVVDPLARSRDPLTRCNDCGVADNSHDITMPARLDPQNAKAILSIMVRDALDETGKNLLLADSRMGVSWSVRQNHQSHACHSAQSGGSGGNIGRVT